MIGDRVVHAGADLPLVLQDGLDAVPLSTRGALETDRVLVVDVSAALGHGRRDHAGRTGQPLVEGSRIGLPLRGPSGQPAQLNPPHGRGHVGHAVVQTHQLVGVLPVHALIAQQSHAARQGGITGGDHAALQGGHVLSGVEGEGPPRPEGPHRHRADRGAVGLSAVLEDGQAILLGYPHDLGHVRRQPVEVHHLDRRRAIGDRGPNAGRIQGEGDRIDVGEHGSGARDRHRVARGREGEGRHDHLGVLGQAAGQRRQVLGRRARIDRHGVNAADDLLGELLLEGGHLRPLNHHARGDDGIDGGALQRPDDRLGRGDELTWHQARTSRIAVSRSASTSSYRAPVTGQRHRREPREPRAC